MFTIRRSTANDVSSNIECEVIRTNEMESFLCDASSKAGALCSRGTTPRLVPETIINRCSNKLVNVFIIIFVRFEQFYTTNCFCVVNMTHIIRSDQMYTMPTLEVQ